MSRIKKIIYFDNAATSLKPAAVLDKMWSYYTEYPGNIHRGIHGYGEKATQEYEHARALVAQFINAHTHEIVFTKGTTESINFVAATWARDTLQPGDEILITELEHHANLVPWQWVAKKTGAVLRYIPITDEGLLDMHAYERMLNERTRLVAVSHVSNAIGTHIPIATVIDYAHRVGARVLIDAAQSIGHEKIDVHDLSADFLAFSGHKMLGPTGIGVLYIRQDLHAEIEPYQRGGNMVHTVDWQDATWALPPQKYEAGTPPIAQAIGLGQAIRYIQEYINFDELKAHEARLCTQLIDALTLMPSVRILGPVEQLKQTGHMVSFVMDHIHAHDVAAYLDTQSIAVRAGHHCAQPLATRLSYTASVRVSFYHYNTVEEVAALIAALDRVALILGR